MFTVLYKTTNLLNSKVYYGVHKTHNIYDNYLGSGTALKAAIVKYGRHNFNKQILYVCLNYKEGLQLEKRLVTPNIVYNKYYYNLREGGSGSTGLEGYFNPFYSKKHSLNTKQQISLKQKQYQKINGNPFKGKSHTEDTKQLLSNLAKARNISKENSLHLYQKSLNLRLGWYITPYGIFETAKAAAKASNCSKSTILNRCIYSSDKPVGYNYQVPKQYQGNKTWKEQGWYLIKFGEV